MYPDSAACNVDVVLFDFGGVLADEGFANGLKAIAQRHGLDETDFINLARDLIHRTGYITGRGREPSYWQAIRRATGITGDDATLRNEILSRFIPRPYMIHIVKRLRTAGIRVVILSDQTNCSMNSTNCTASSSTSTLSTTAIISGRARPTPRTSPTPSPNFTPHRTACSSSTTTKATAKGPAWRHKRNPLHRPGTIPHRPLPILPRRLDGTKRRHSLKDLPLARSSLRSSLKPAKDAEKRFGRISKPPKSGRLCIPLKREAKERVFLLGGNDGERIGVVG